MWQQYVGVAAPVAASSPAGFALAGSHPLLATLLALVAAVLTVVAMLIAAHVAVKTSPGPQLAELAEHLKNSSLSRAQQTRVLVAQAKRQQTPPP